MIKNDYPNKKLHIMVTMAHIPEMPKVATARPTARLLQPNVVHEKAISVSASKKKCTNKKYKNFIIKFLILLYWMKA